MKLGVFLPVSGRAAVPEVLAEAAQQAENLGYDAVWAAERLVNPWDMNTAYPYKEDQKWQGFVAPNVPFLEPLTCLSFLAGVTKKVGLGISVAVLPYRNALVAAKAAGASVVRGAMLALVVPMLDHRHRGSAQIRRERDQQG